MDASLKQSSADKIKILHIIDTLSIGGAEKVLVTTINNLPEFEHHLIYLSSPEDFLPKINSDCRIFKLNWKTKLSLIGSVFKVRRYIRRNKIKIVHSQLALATVVARLACSKKVRLISTIQNRPSKSYFSSSPILKFLENVLYRRRHYIIAVSKIVLDDYKESIGLKGGVSILNNFIEDKFFKSEIRESNHSGNLKLVAVGNLHYQKNYPYLIEVFKKLPSSISLDIYGWGNMKDQLQKEIDKYGLNINLCGVRDDLEKLLPKYDAMILASHYEGNPLVVLEAMASGLPVILSDIPSLREVSNGNALFFDKDNPKDLRKKLIALLNDEINLDEIAKVNLQRAEKIARKERYFTELKQLYLADI